MDDLMLNQFLLLAAILFAIGVYGVIARKNTVMVLMSIELILNAVNINLLTFGAAMTFFIGGLFFFSFARWLDCSETASLIGGAAFMFNGVLAFFVGWPIGRAWTWVAVAAWLAVFAGMSAALARSALDRLRRGAKVAA